jgi:hypothetical protein
MFLHTGFGQGGRPSLGAWVTYGLGAENRDLPAYVVMLSGPPGGAGSTLWSTGFLPSVYQGIQFRGSGEPVLLLRQILPVTSSRKTAAVCSMQSKRSTSSSSASWAIQEIATRISQYEMAYRMQTSVPELMDISAREPRPRSTCTAQGLPGQGLLCQQLPARPPPRRARRAHRAAL